MALYGLRVRDASGNITLDIIDRIARLVFSTIASPNTDGSVTLPEISGKTSYQFAIALETNKLAHFVQRNNTVISWAAEGGGNAIYESSTSMILVFMDT